MTTTERPDDYSLLAELTETQLAQRLHNLRASADFLHRRATDPVADPSYYARRLQRVRHLLDLTKQEERRRKFASQDKPSSSPQD